MINEEAIKHFKSLQKRYTKEHNGRMCEKVNLALEALEKQIPKMPVHIESSGTCMFMGDCPVCGEPVISCEEYCDICGQALDWSDDE